MLINCSGNFLISFKYISNIISISEILLYLFNKVACDILLFLFLYSKSEGFISTLIRLFLNKISNSELDKGVICFNISYSSK